MLPTIDSVIVGGGGGGVDQPAPSFRALKSETAAATQTALDTGAAALVTLQQQLTTCKYSGGDDCLDDVTSVSVLGDYRQETGYCAAFDAAYVNVTAGAALPAQYFPIGVEEAYAQGFANNFSAWSETNQDKFQTDYPLLYNETVMRRRVAAVLHRDPVREAESAGPRTAWTVHVLQDEPAQRVVPVHVPPEQQLVRGRNAGAAHGGRLGPRGRGLPCDRGGDVVRDLHDFCEVDTGFMPLVCGMNGDKCSTTGSDVLEYLGAHSYDGVGPPAQVNFTTMEQLSATEQAEKICACGSSNSTDCFSPMDTRLESCVDTCGSLCAVSAHHSREYEAACYRSGSSSVSDDLSTVTSDSTASTSSSSGSTSAADKIQSLLSDLSARAETGSFAVLNYVLAVLAFFAATALALGFAYSTRYGKKKRQSILDDPINGRMGSSMLSPVNFDQLKGIGRWDDRLTQQLKRWGDFVTMGNHLLYIILLSLMLVVCCSSGLARMEVETDSMKLWASEDSTVFQERTRFGEMLGPVDRAERLVLVAKDGGAVTRSAYIKEAIRLQQIVAEDVSSDSVKLSDICVKDASNSPCQVNAVTQYFQNSMDHFAVYETYGLVGKHLSNCANAPEREDADACSELKVQINASGSSLPTNMSDCPCVSAFGVPMTGLQKYLGGFTADGYSVDASTRLRLCLRLLW